MDYRPGRKYLGKFVFLDVFETAIRGDLSDPVWFTLCTEKEILNELLKVRTHVRLGQVCTRVQRLQRFCGTLVIRSVHITL